jgi:hypothetical protein
MAGKNSSEEWAVEIDLFERGDLILSGLMRVGAGFPG